LWFRAPAVVGTRAPLSRETAFGVTVALGEGDAMKIADHEDLKGSIRPIVAGSLLLLAGVAYLGLFNNDPTKASFFALILSLPLFYGAVISFRRGELRVVRWVTVYASWLPWACFLLAVVGLLWGFGFIMGAAGFILSFIAYIALSPYEDERDPLRLEETSRVAENHGREQGIAVAAGPEVPVTEQGGAPEQARLDAAEPRPQPDGTAGAAPRG